MTVERIYVPILATQFAELCICTPVVPTREALTYVKLGGAPDG